MATANSDDNPLLVLSFNQAEKCQFVRLLMSGFIKSKQAECDTCGGLSFIRPAKSQRRWYGLHTSQEKTSSSGPVSSWNTDTSSLNSIYSRIARAAGNASTRPASLQISQENLRRWEKSAHESSEICNQAAGFNRCLYSRITCRNN